MGSPLTAMVLSGRLALVTGGGRGIGGAVCQVLARDNAKVVVTDLSMNSCQETMESLRPDDHFSVASDVSQAGSVNDCFKQILDKYKRAPDISQFDEGAAAGWLHRQHRQHCVENREHWTS